MAPAGGEQGAGEAPQGPGSKSEVAPLHVLARPQPRPEAVREHRLTAARLGLGLRGPLTSRPRLIPASVVLRLGCSCGQVRSLAGGRPDLPGVAAPRLHGRPGASRRAAPGRGLQPPLGNPGGRSSRPEGHGLSPAVAARSAGWGVLQGQAPPPSGGHAHRSPGGWKGSGAPAQDTAGVRRAGGRSGASFPLTPRSGASYPHLFCPPCPPLGQASGDPKEWAPGRTPAGAGTRYLVELLDPPDQVRVAGGVLEVDVVCKGGAVGAESMSAVRSPPLPRVLAGGGSMSAVRSPPPTHPRVLAVGGGVS